MSSTASPRRLRGTHSSSVRSTRNLSAGNGGRNWKAMTSSIEPLSQRSYSSGARITGMRGLSSATGGPLSCHGGVDRAPLPGAPAESCPGEDRPVAHAEPGAGHAGARPFRLREGRQRNQAAIARVGDHPVPHGSVRSASRFTGLGCSRSPVDRSAGAESPSARTASRGRRRPRARRCRVRRVWSRRGDQARAGRSRRSGRRSPGAASQRIESRLAQYPE